MRINITDLQQFVNEANNTSEHRTELERGIFVSPVTTEKYDASSGTYRVNRSVVASFSPDYGKNVVTHEVDLGHKDFVPSDFTTTPQKQKKFQNFADQHMHELERIRDYLTSGSQGTKIYSGTLEP